MRTHIPNKREPLVRYYGFYSNRCRGDRKKRGTNAEVPSVIDSNLFSKAFWQNWARLIQKIAACPAQVRDRLAFLFVDTQLFYVYTIVSRKRVPFNQFILKFWQIELPFQKLFHSLLERLVVDVSFFCQHELPPHQQLFSSNLLHEKYPY